MTAGGELVRRRDEDHSGVLGKPRGVEAVAIDGDWHQPCSGSAEYLSDAVVVRVFDGDAVATLDEDAGDEVERLLGAVDDDDFGWIADDGAGAAKWAQMASRRSRLPTASP